MGGAKSGGFDLTDRDVSFSCIAFVLVGHSDVIDVYVM